MSRDDTRVLVAKTAGDRRPRDPSVPSRPRPRAVVVHSEPDAGSLATELADRAVACRAPTPADTYLDIERLLGAAGRRVATRSIRATASWPRTPAFAARSGGRADWIGPAARRHRADGRQARRPPDRRDAGVPSCRERTVAVDDADAVAALGDELGWPLAVKAVHGGAGAACE